MEVVHTHCAGLDIHQKLVVACVITPGPGGTPQQEVRSFGTMTADLLALGDWLAAAGITQVAMESTGSFWKPLYNLLEDRFTLLLVNPQHIKAVPGRKTGVKDSEWLAGLLRHGLLRPSFVPDRAQRELRELTRYRTSLVQERSTEVNRLQKTLEGSNIKLGSVATDVLGKPGRAMLEALVSGVTDGAALAELARGRMRSKLPQWEQALSGRFEAHQRFLVARQLTHLDDLDALIEQLSSAIAERVRADEEAIERLDEIPGVGRATAEVLVAEVGTDMSRFPSAGHRALWAGMCPGNRQSAGKRHSGRTRKGNHALRAALGEAAHAAGRTKDSYLQAQYRRLAARRGKKKTAVAVGHSLLVIVYYLLAHPERRYADRGGDYFVERDRETAERRAVARLERLGYKVTLEPAVA